MANFRKTFLSGVFYTSIAKYIGIILQIIISAILARLLQPDDFGIVAIATVVIGFISLLTDFGMAPAIVQNDDLDTKDINSLFSFTVYIGFLASFILFISANTISQIYDDERLCPIIRLLSLNVFFATINIVPNSLLLKNKKFKVIAIRTLLIQSIGGALAIGAALFGCGVYSLVINSIFASLGIFVFNYNQNRISLCFRIEISPIMKIFKFSLTQFIAQIVTYINGTIDKLLVGKLLGMSDLGYYEKSYRLMRMPVSNLTYVFTPVMQPLFKAYKNDLVEMEHKYSKLFRTIAIIGFPLSCYLYFSASDLICLFFGERWLPAVRPFQLFSISAGLSMLLSSTGPLYQTTNSLKSQISSTFGETAIGLGCLFLGLKLGGVNNVALCVSIGILLRFIYSFVIIYHFVFRMHILNIFRYMIHAFIGVLVLFMIMQYTQQISDEKFSLLRLVLNTISFVIVVFLMMYAGGILNLKFLNKFRK